MGIALILYLPHLEASEGCDPLYAVISQIFHINMQAVSLESIPTRAIVG
jgi:hypothetical protein